MDHRKKDEDLNRRQPTKPKRVHIVEELMGAYFISVRFLYNESTRKRREERVRKIEPTLI